MLTWYNQKTNTFSFCTLEQCCGSGMFIPDPGSRNRLFSIPDPNCLHPGSRILIKEFKYFNPQKSSKKYDPGCSSRIPDPDADFLPSRIPDPGVKKNLSILTPKKALKNMIRVVHPGSRIPDPDADFLQSWIPDPDPQHCSLEHVFP